MSSINLERTCDATANSGYSNRWTFSAWVKRGLIGTEQGLFANKRTDNNTNSRFRFRIKSTNKLCWEIKDSSGNDDSSFETTMLFRDTNAWYHIVFIYDSDNSTESERMKCYVNGKDVRTELGGFSSVNEVGSGFGSLWSSSVKNYLGVSHDNSGNPYRWDGLMSHVHFTYGYRYEASTFGATDSTTGEWKINTNPSVTYGSQGFWLFKDNASVTDQSGEGNNYTLNAGTLTKTEDNPSNVFATWNPLIKTVASFSNGNLSCTTASGEFGSASSLGVSQGKYYAEFKVTASSLLVLGVADENGVDYSSNNNISSGKTGATGSIGFPVFSGVYRINNSNTSYGNSFAQNDIVSIAIDYANQKIYLGKNGTWQNSANPASGTGGIDVSSVLTGNDWFFTIGDDTNTSGSSADANFGNGYFGTTAVASAGTNASGNGIFEYDVPTGFTALSTKGLNE